MADTKLVICEKCWGTGHVHGGEENSTWSKTCEDCRGIGFVRVPMTNADRIRGMSDEELAKLIVDNHPMHAWNKEVRHIFFDGPRITHKEAWLQWLKQPAEE